MWAVTGVTTRASSDPLGMPPLAMLPGVDSIAAG
jgi:hypothetical protein